MKSIVVEAHPLVRAGATHVLQSLPAVSQVISVEPGEALFENLAAHADAELALIGLPLPGIDDIPALTRLLQQPHPRHIAVLGESDSPAHVRAVMQLNISAYLLKSYAGKLIAAALELVLAGGRYVPASIVLARPDSPLAATRAGNDDCALLGLTQRQYEILVLLSRGHPVKTISRMLGISEATTKAHINALYRRLEVRSRTEAIFVATQRGAMLMSHPRLGLVEAPVHGAPARLARTG
ncbi:MULTISPECIES: LuxR C-terminal-related transcriptional regulator [Ralstonia solanacearum species complex]|uniref:DNA-binding response regulator n=2 Tax=Ralstonia solanacearum species complex TaxID=3116862 RepID=A0AAD0SAH7_RALSL|nr:MULTISPECIES: response regulator transcription factor [Ralstonia solanacearum species complex]AXV83490.1 DNA-binding response regulator [Ralstonia solanacearum]AXV88278.1 DNA-binding response regulator [Ralstonia solanacearum]AXW07758.1 DNA-binding response regulator [Ralstonia solanacearum]AXW25551.1 DNA-binding response regulator [Ralstonia solanacearum]AXW54623.1 DNA-binding response regulator [Ralstonia solanacearum]